MSDAPLNMPLASSGSDEAPEPLKCLLFSYYFRNTGFPSAHHLMDRLPIAAGAGLRFRVISSWASIKARDLPQMRVPPILPGDLRFVLRMICKRWYGNTRRAGVLWKLLFLPFFPFFLLERILPLRDFTWSWCLPASLTGVAWCLKDRPDVIYSFGGRNSAHLAAAMVSRICRIPWVAQLQDPLIHGYAWKTDLEERFVRKTEQIILSGASRVVFMTDGARRAAEARTGATGKGVVNYPGFDAAFFRQGRYRRSGTFRMLHVGSFGGTRNPATFLAALRRAVERVPEMRRRVRLILLGNFGTETRPLLDGFPWPEMIDVQGFVPREEAYRRMEMADILVLIQNREEISSETIPSKFYEYLFAGRPILGLTYRNPELTGLMEGWGHRAVELDDEPAVTGALVELFSRWQDGGLACVRHEGYPTTSGSAMMLARLLRQAAQNAPARSDG